MQAFYTSKSRPKNIIAPDQLPVPTILNGDKTINIGRVLKTQAHFGKGVAPETTAINSVTQKTNSPT